MTILLPHPNDQTLQVIPRRGNDSNIGIVWYDELERTSYATTNLPAIYTGGFLICNTDFSGSTFTPTEGRFYSFVVSDTNGELYKGRAFCTAQTDFTKYSVNQSTYTQEATKDNEFIIL